MKGTNWCLFYLLHVAIVVIYCFKSFRSSTTLETFETFETFIFEHINNIMALATNPKQLSGIPVIDYKHIRPFLKTGDIIFCSGDYFFSKIIQSLTKSTWSHCGIIYKDHDLDRVLILESETMVGVRLIPVSKYLEDYKETHRSYKGKIIVATLENPATPPDLKKGISFGLDQLAQPYDNWEIFRILLRILFKKGKRERNRNFICSELVRDIYTRSGVKIQLHDSYISPDDIWKLPDVKLKYRIL
ncbi:MAG: YiiX/YebB-like N1pC/P60 family cysteine hydrolase [Ferruginibacter sp.]